VTDTRPADPPSGGIRELLGPGDFRTLLAGQAVSGLGDWMATVALMALVLDLTGSSAAVGVILVLRLAPAVLAGPLTTRIVSRWNRRRTMLAMDAIRVVIVALVPLVAAVWWVYTLAFTLEVAGLIFLPARDAAIPELAGADDLPLADGLMLGSSYGTIPLGAGLFGLVSALFGGGHAHGGAMSIVFLADAATFAVSFAAVWRIRSIDAKRTDERSRSRERDRTFSSAFRLPIVRVVAPAAAVAALGIGSLFSLGIVFVRNVLGASNTQFAVLVALFGLGAAVGLGVLQLWHLRGLLVVRVALALQGLTIAGMSLAPGVGLAFCGAVLFGGTTAVVLSAAMDVLQQRLSEQQRVNAFAAFHVIIRGGLAIAAIAAGAAGDLLSDVTWPVVGRLAPARVVLLCSGLVVFVVSLATSGLRERLSEQSSAPEPAPDASFGTGRG
jgi:predicted MFS family arabinose efflux permease